jgi:heme-degrading monooxygenase HmoA
MYARVAVFDNPRLSDASLVDELQSRARESAPQWRDALPNARGHLMLMDREKGLGVGITFFDSEEQIREAEPVFDRMGDEMPEETRGRRTAVEVYEVLSQEVRGDAKAARVSTLEGSPDSVDDWSEETRDKVVPRVRAMSGNTGVLVLVDRRAGVAKAITLWDSEDSLRAGEQEAEKLRQESASIGGSKITGVERYEVAMAERLAELGASR